MRGETAKATRESRVYRVVQLDFTPEIEVFHMLFERCHSKNRKSSIKQHAEYFNFLCKIQFDHSVHLMDKKDTTYNGLRS